MILKKRSKTCFVASAAPNWQEIEEEMDVLHSFIPKQSTVIGRFDYYSVTLSLKAFEGQ